jgi:hypothetical protein
VTSPLPNRAMRFANLDGAAIAASAIGQWALSSSFGADNVRIVSDEPVGGKANPVTRERVQQAVDELFPAGADVVEHFILAFCGHGLTDANLDSISWLFSDSLRWKYRVIANEFYTELLFHGIQRITLISDACREAPKDLDLMRLDGVRGIAVQGTQVESPKFDRFAACQDGQLGFMVSELNSAKPGKCIFSGVIADVLWGVEPAAIKDGVITTATFGAYVRSRTAERAKDYHLKLNPQCFVDPEATVLYNKAKPPSPWSGLQPWPPAGDAAAMGTAGAPAGASTDVGLESVRSNERPMLGSGLNRLELSISKESLGISDKGKELLKDIGVLRTTPLATVADARKRAAGEFRRSLDQVGPLTDPNGSNLIVVGAGARLWSRDPVTRAKPTSARTEFRVSSDAEGTPILVEFANGFFTPIVPYERLYVYVQQNAAGEVLQAYGQHNSSEAFKAALTAIEDFGAGRIGPDRIDELAGRLRVDKHVDPVLGAICAYLYRAIADFDSIRRMAYFYVNNDQPVPFDIALLGAMKVTREADGTPRLQVPAVKARKQQEGKPDLPEFVTAATPVTQAWIGGRCPWLGLGWDYVGLPRPDWAALVEGLADHTRKIHRNGFTVLPNEVGLALAESWKLQQR